MPEHLILQTEGSHHPPHRIWIHYPHPPGTRCRKCTLLLPGARGRHCAGKLPFRHHQRTYRGTPALALDCTIDEAKQTQLEIPFKGNVDPKKLEKALQEHSERIPFVIVTITNNTAGGQPVSMQNLREVRAIADKYGKPVLFDSARFAENAYFIKMREEGYRNKSIKEITREMFDLADGMTMSAKKDGIVNMGGFIATRRKDWYEGAKGFCVQFEGYLTYGGMNGRDMNALAIGWMKILNLTIWKPAFTRWAI